MLNFGASKTRVKGSAAPIDPHLSPQDSCRLCTKHRFLTRRPFSWRPTACLPTGLRREVPSEQIWRGRGEGELRPGRVPYNLTWDPPFPQLTDGQTDRKTKLKALPSHFKYLAKFPENIIKENLFRNRRSPKICYADRPLQDELTPSDLQILAISF